MPRRRRPGSRPEDAKTASQGALVVDATSDTPVPAHAIAPFDTTGCGDAFSAGFIVGRRLGRDLHTTARLGCAAAALVAAGLGSGHGDFVINAADEFAQRTPILE